jgi:hypothetical protein
VQEATAAVTGPFSRLLSLGCRVRFVCAVSPDRRAQIFSSVIAEQSAVQLLFLPDTASKAEAFHFALQQPTPEQYFMWFDSPAGLKPRADARGWLFRAIRQLRVAEVVGAVDRGAVTEKHCAWIQRRIGNFEFRCPKYVNYIASNWLLARRSSLLEWEWPVPEMDDSEMDLLLGLWLYAKKLSINHFRDDVQIDANEFGAEKALC